MRSVWLSPGFPAPPSALLDALGADYALAPPLTSPPAGSIAVVTGFEHDLLARLIGLPTQTSLIVLTPPEAASPADDVPGLRADAVVAAASIAEVADALRRLPRSAPAAAAPGDDLPWWIRPPQEPAPSAPPQAHDTGSYATTPLPRLGAPDAAPTEMLAFSSEAPAGRRVALTRPQARIASVVAVVIAVAAAALVVGLDRNSSPANAAATSGSNVTPLGGANGANPFNGQGGAGNSQSNGGPQSGTQAGPLTGQNRSGVRAQEIQEFLACLKRNGVSIDVNRRPFFDPTDPQMRAALRTCASALPFGRLRDGSGHSDGGANSKSSSGASGTHST